MKLFILVLIRTSQGTLISAGITILIILAIILTCAFILSITLNRLNDFSQNQDYSINYTDIHNLIKITSKKLISDDYLATTN